MRRGLQKFDMQLGLHMEKKKNLPSQGAALLFAFSTQPGAQSNSHRLHCSR